jgi:hypothetical protein
MNACDVKANINTNMFGRNMTKHEKVALRHKMKDDVDRWLAEGRTIDDRGVSVDDTDSRRAFFDQD